MRRKSFWLDHVMGGSELVRPVVRRVSESDHVRAQALADLIDSPPAKTAAEVAAMIGLLIEEAEGRVVGVVAPIDAARLEVLCHGFEGAQEFALLHSERAYGKLNRGAVAKPEQRFKQRERILTAGERHRHAIAIADHPEASDRIAHFAEKSFFQVQALIIV
jgi:hypothetical protein